MILAYGIISLFTTVAYLTVQNKYYRGTIDSTSSKVGLYSTALISGTFWPFGLPVIVYYYWDAIKGVLKGKDWADDNILDDSFREYFRENEEEAHRQVRRDIDLQKQGSVKTKESSFK